MARTGPVRPLLAVKTRQENIDALDDLAKKAGVSRSDVARFGLAMALREVDQDALVDYLAQARKEGEPDPLTPEWRKRLLTSEAVVNEVGMREFEGTRKNSPSGP